MKSPVIKLLALIECNAVCVTFMRISIRSRWLINAAASTKSSLGRVRVLLNVANARDICVPIGNSFY